MAQIFPSLMAGDPLFLGQIIQLLDPIAHGYHLDIADFHFAPNLPLSLPAVNAIAQASSRPLWIHLMVDKPMNYFDHLRVPPGTIITFHIEISEDIRTVINRILSYHWHPGIALKPETEVTKVFPYLEYLHQVMVMGVQPGYSGQKFMPEVLKKLDPLIGFRDTSKIHFNLAIDGGIGAEQIPLLLEKGVDEIAVGSGIFEGKDIVKNLKMLQKLK